MTLSTPDRRGYVVIDRTREAEASPRLATVMTGLLADGWRKALEIDGLIIYLGPDSPLVATQVHRRHILIGDWRGDGVFLSSLAGGHRTAAGLAQAVVSQGWGRYVFVWRDDDGSLQLLRDPSGALDCLCWRTTDGAFATSQPPEALNAVLPDEIEIDWDVLGEISGAVNLASDRLALTGMDAVMSGNLARVGETITQQAVWRPAWFAKTAFWDDRPQGLVEVVDRATRALVAGHDRILTEISGGLDSAIIAASLVEAGGAGASAFINFFDDQPEGDERAFARAAAAHLGVRLEEVHKPVAPLTQAQFEPLGQGVRPALHGLDMVYDAHMASRARADGATGLLTGQGGDAVFFQSPDPLVVADRFRREGLRGLAPGDIAAVGRWTRHSAWTIARHSVLPGPRPPARRRSHPWTSGMEALPPAKVRQVQQLSNCQTFWSDCLRARSATLLHPLLTQPVMEHCLAIPADRLTRGARDRGMARLAFNERLPSEIAERREKGDLSRFYSQVVRFSAPVLQDLLAGGRLAEKQVIDGEQVAAALVESRLVWDAATNRFLILAVLEVWARNWEQRIGRVRRAKIAAQPLQNP